MELSRLGFRSPEAAAARLAEIDGCPDDLVEQVAQVADPDTCLASLARIAEHIDGGAPALVALLSGDEELRLRLLVVLGTSEALGDFLARHPEYVTDLAEGELLTRPATIDEYRAWMRTATDADELRVQYHRALLRIAARDLTALTSFVESSGELADLAIATLDGALAIVQGEEEKSELTRLSIMAMGKTGGHELNYVSDVDVIFVYEAAEDADDNAALVVATRMASAVMRMCREHTPEGTIWEVDANLRPEGKNGPLVRSLGSHVAYYEKWASTWEFQALLKARYAAGDAELAQRYLDELEPMVWFASTRPNFVSDVRSMRKRVVDNIPHTERERQLKLGRGGLRDVEFAVQMLQLVHGRADPSVRDRTTVLALHALTEGGYVGRRDGAALEEAYEFLRTLEHRIQLFRLRRTHIVPEDSEDLRRIGRSMGYRQNPVDSLTKEWQAHRRVVSRLHEKLFYRPLLDAVASLPTEGLRLTQLAAEQRLAALGFADPAGAMKHIEALTSGVSRRAAIQQSLLPAMLSWFAESPDPDSGLLAFRSISEELGESHWYLRKLRDEGVAAEQLASLLSSSTYVTQLITRAPDVVALLGDDSELVPHDLDRLSTEMALAAKRHDVPDDAIKAIRRVRRRELARVSMADVLGMLDVVAVGEALTAINTATLQAALDVAMAAYEQQKGPVTVRMAVVLMGRLGGFEAGYGSDADVMFVHEPLEGAADSDATACATWVAQTLRQQLAVAGAEPPLQVDADLRPEGKNGPLVRSLASYAAYYAKWSDTWEAQALLRATAGVGDADLCRRYTELIDPLRYPEDGLSEREIREIRRIKARVDAERLPRGANPNTHLKLGRGGLADIEWTAQLLQLEHAGRLPSLRTTRTIAAIDAAAEEGLLEREDADTLIEAWTMVSRIRNGVVLMRAKGAESMVEANDDRARLAHLIGDGADRSEELVDQYRKITRQARKIVEKVFWE